MYYGMKLFPWGDTPPAGTTIYYSVGSHETGASSTAVGGYILNGALYTWKASYLDGFDSHYLVTTGEFVSAGRLVEGARALGLKPVFIGNAENLPSSGQGIAAILQKKVDGGKLLIPLALGLVLWAVLAARKKR